MPAQFESFAFGEDVFPATTVTVPKPAGTVKDDLLIAWGQGTGATPWLPPAGWAKTFEGVNTSRVGFLASLVAGSSEPASYIFTFAGRSGDFIVAIMRFSGVDPSNPVDVQTVFAQTDSISPIQFPCPPINTTVANTLIVCLDMADRGGTIITGTLDRPGFTERVDVNAPLGFQPSLRACTRDLIQVIPGATGATETAIILHLPDAGTHVGFVGTLAIASLLGGGGGLMGEPMLRREVMERSMRVPIPRGTRLKNPVRRIEDPWGELKRK